MEFRNHTPFPALAFEGIDQHDQAFHVVVLRQSLTWDGDAVLVYADEQAPLCEADEYFGAVGTSSVRQESDLCHYKPKCDVIVNASAYPPPGKAARHCRVRLEVRTPDTAAALPPRPQGLNQFQEPSAQRLQAWRSAVAHAQAHPVPGKRLVDKTLVVTGQRELVRRIWPLRLVAGLLRGVTLGLYQGGAWRLSAPRPLGAVPVRYEHAYGGACRIDRNDARAKRIPRKHRLSPQQSAAHAGYAPGGPDASGPAALAAFEGNAVGSGFSQPWYARATRLRRLAAPQIELPDAPFSVARFRKLQADRHQARQPEAARPAGLGVRARVHPARRALGGTADEAFAQSSAWLPQDFDFAVWNGAPQDQQTVHLRGDETIALTNLCAPGSPGAGTTARGDTVLNLRLPGHTATLLLRMDNGTMFFHPMKIDTLIVEPELRSVSIVWRAVFADSGDIRVAEARHHKEFEADFTQQLQAALNAVPLDDLLEPQAKQGHHRRASHG